MSPEQIDNQEIHKTKLRADAYAKLLKHGMESENEERNVMETPDSYYYFNKKYKFIPDSLMFVFMALDRLPEQKLHTMTETGGQFFPREDLLTAVEELLEEAAQGIKHADEDGFVSKLPDFLQQPLHQGLEEYRNHWATTTRAFEPFKKKV